MSSAPPDLRAALLHQLRTTQAGEPWFGASRSALLEDVSVERAAAHHIAGAHSIWELVLHMTAWTREVRRRLAGGEPAEPADGDWPSVGATSAAAWEAAKAALAAAHADIIAAIEALPAERWSAEVGNGIDVAGTLVGLAQHDAYHTGQIGLLRKASS